MILFIQTTLAWQQKIYRPPCFFCWMVMLFYDEFISIVCGQTMLLIILHHKIEFIAFYSFLLFSEATRLLSDLPCWNLLSCKLLEEKLSYNSDCHNDTMSHWHSNALFHSFWFLTNDLRGHTFETQDIHGSVPMALLSSLILFKLYPIKRMLWRFSNQ